MLSLEQKLYQLIISRLDGEKISSSSYGEKAVDLVRKGIGGFIVFGGKKDEVKGFIEKMQTIPEIPLFIASDIERGVGQQLEGATVFPGQMSVAAATDRHDPDSVNILEDTIKAVAYEAIDAGINMPLVPVLDVNRNPDNPIICTRAFSDNPEVVAWFGRMYISTLEKTGLISCAKHFPGHGDTAVDSHISLPLISKSFEELNNADLIPFIEAVKANVGSIMMGHISVPAIDDLPASLSKKAVDLLRTGFGYEGLILTDALNMHALKEVRDIAVKCMNAGIDILLHPESPDAAAEELFHAVEAGRLAKEKIEAAAARILKYKAGIKNIKKVRTDTDKHEALSRSISDKSITLVKGKTRLMPFKDVQKASLVFSADENKHDLSALKTFIPGSAHIREYEGKALKETIIVALFTRIAAWEGSSGIRDEEINSIRALIKRSRTSIVISFGNPYVLRHFTEADILIAAYDATEQAQSSVIRCMRGDIVFQGRLPVELKV
jgi:beta-N-acetylhexosaminidase